MARGDERSRETILHRIEQAVGSAPPPTLRVGSPIVRNWDVEDRFIQEFSRAGGVVYRARSGEEARKALQEIVRGAGASRVARWESPLLGLLQVDVALTAVGLDVVPLPSENREVYGKELNAVEVGLTEVDYAVAETGTLVLFADPVRPRAVSLLPKVHVAILPRGALVSTFEELFSRLASQESRPSAITFITGPSRTADIEMTPVMGVHGPQAVYVILLDLSFLSLQER
ncbi:MAG: lactate utilization protein [Armatimonadota bacterium]|nr:lactate utilization protein [Armatimonadota bacterium]